MVPNVFLLCPNHDALFDGGYITFEDDGTIVISDRLSQLDCTFTNVLSTMKIQLSDKNKEYLE
ncbi:HNH endonuclease [Mediterraneibacter faecis]|uniref:HNH endonuclease n=1 Tax=Mediterraneibacter faecis TaxID=592978 RepID=UPI002FE6CD0E